MIKKYNLSLFIFRRDIRLQDNTALNAALEQSKAVFPCFIFDPRQVGNSNSYKSDNAIQFMLQSLRDLEGQLSRKKGKLYYFYGLPTNIIQNLLKTITIDAIFVNADYTPFSIKRDLAMAELCKKLSIAFEQYDDVLLHNPGTIVKKDNSFYTVFTAFYKKALTVPVKDMKKLSQGTWFCDSIKSAENKDILKKIVIQNNVYAFPGGTQEALKIIKHLNVFKNYKQTHDYPALNSSHLSAHLKFGTISVRQVYYAIIESLGRSHPLLRQLYWRDFFMHITFCAPHVFVGAYRKKYNQLRWSNDKKIFKQWCEGKTGFPVIDAGMRELNTTGFMHNRVRMIVASFLVKDLHINWQWGERYFAQKLLDYDPAVNNGNWQWCASTGCDAQPYFRIFNPWLQQKKYDPECVYIKQWVPELRLSSVRAIHNWFKKDSELIANYPRPIIDHSQETKIAKEIYRSLPFKDSF